MGMSRPPVLFVAAGVEHSQEGDASDENDEFFDAMEDSPAFITVTAGGNVQHRWDPRRWVLERHRHLEVAWKAFISRRSGSNHSVMSGGMSNDWTHNENVRRPKSTNDLTTSSLVYATWSRCVLSFYRTPQAPITCSCVEQGAAASLTSQITPSTCGALWRTASAKTFPRYLCL